MGVRRVTKEDMKRIAKATGATMALTLSNMEGEESFDPSMLGYGQFCCCFLIISECFCLGSFRSLSYFPLFPLSTLHLTLHLSALRPALTSTAEEVVQERICDDELIIIHKPKVCMNSHQ